MSKNKHKFTVQVSKTRMDKSEDTIDIALGFDDPWQTIVLLPWEVEKLAEALNKHLETKND